MSHLSDETLQRYLDGETLADRAAVERHLRSCSQCHQQLQIYQTIVRESQHEAAFSMPPDFADKVMERVAATTPKASANLEWYVLGALLVLGAGVAAYFQSLTLVVNLLWRILGEGLAAVLQSLAAFKSASLPGAFRWDIFAMALFVLIVMGLFDRFIFQTVMKKF